MAPLRRAWGDDFPLVNETPPDPPVDDSNVPAFLPGRGTWPLPMTRYYSLDEDHAVAFQGDRFEVSWTFSEEGGGRGYPGFDSLAGVLREKFDDFEKTVGEAGVVLAITGCECQYLNVIEGQTSAGLAVGILTRWSGTPDPGLPSAGYVGMRLHACPDEKGHNCASLLGVDGDANEDARLTIHVSRSSGSEGDAPLGGLYDAHSELIGIFDRYTSDEQQQKWGRIA